MKSAPDRRPLLVVLRALGLGDFLTGVPALRALADAYPHHHRVLAAPRALAPLVPLIGGVYQVVDTEPLAALEPTLHGTDVAVNLHGGGPQSHRLLLDTHPRRLVAFSNPHVPESADGPPWYPGEHEVRRWCRLLEASGIPADPAGLDLSPPRVPAPDEGTGATLIHPGAASTARRWPPDRWATVAQSEKERGHTVVITGGPGEVDLARTVARMSGLEDSAVYAGRTNLLELAALVAAAGRVVCGDTGVAHLATALHTPSVVLFGPVPPAEWGPPERPWHRALWSGKRGDPHGNRPNDSLLEIEPKEVLAALAGLPEAVPEKEVL